MSICAENAKKLAQELFGKKNINDKQIEGFVRKLGTRAQNISKSQMKTYEESLKIATDELIEQSEASAAKMKQRTYLNAKLLIENKNTIDNFKDKSKGLKSILEGTSKFRNSISTLIPSTFNKIMGGKEGVYSRLRREGLVEVFQDNSKLLDLGRSLFGEAIEDTEVARVGEIIKDGYEDTRKIQNSLGASIGKLDTFMASTTHDPMKMLKINDSVLRNTADKIVLKREGKNLREVSRNRWVDFVWNKLDHDKTFADISRDPKSVREFLESTYDSLVSNIRKDFQDELKVSNEFRRGASFAKRLSPSRVLHFKDSISWMDYNKTYGTGDLRDSILTVFERGARNIAIMKKLGPDAVMNYEKLRKFVSQSQRDDPRIKSKLFFIDNIFKEIDGTSQNAVNLKFAKISSNLRRAQSLSKLGAVTLRSVPDLALKAANFRFNGLGLFDRWFSTFSDLSNMVRTNKELQEIYDLIGVGAESMKGAGMRFGMDNSVAGLMTKSEQLFFKWNGLKRWDNVNREGTAATLARFLAQNKNKKWANLKPQTKNALSIYDISEKDWEVIRKYPNKIERGTEFITSDSANQITKSDAAFILDKKIEDVSNKEFEGVKDSLIDKLMIYFSDNANHVILQPTAGDRAVIVSGQPRGTVLGEALRFIGQFKVYPVSFARRVLPRIASGRDSVSALSELAVGTAILTYMSDTAIGLFNNKAPVNPAEIEGTANKINFFSKMILPSMGIWGDFIGGEYNRYGGGALNSLAGPVLSNVNDLSKMYAQLREGDVPTKSMFYFVKNNTPFQNLFWLRPAMKYMFLNSMEERINPGAMLRARDRLLKNGQDQIIDSF